MQRIIPLVLLLAAAAALAEDGELKFADLGRCVLERGGVIDDCRVGYRTLGELDADRSNAVLVPTWYTGTTAELVADGEPAFLPPNRYFVILVDALGNGVSSSPSNSATQAGETFPEITIGDMVLSQHRLLTEVLGLDHLHAVVGASMGGMQTFEWAVRYPDFMDFAVPIVGSPRLAAYDIALWHALRQLLELSEDCDCEEARVARASLGILVGATPELHQRQTDPATVLDQIATSAAAMDMDHGRSDDLGLQALAMMTHDVSRHFDGDMAQAAVAVQAKLFVVVGEDDHVVTPGPALAFAELIDGPTLILRDQCGHGADRCSAEEMNAAVRAFLLGKP